MKDELIGYYVERQAVKTGQFKLSGGGTSDFYIDGRMVMTHPPALRLIAKWFAQLIEEHDLLDEHTTLVGPALSGVPLAAALSLELDHPYVIDRGKAKGHGLAKRYEGAFADGPRCLMVDDLITVGSTLQDAIRALREEGREVEHALITVDRQQGGPEALAAMGVTAHVLLTQEELRAATP